MIVKLLTEHHLEFLSLKEGCRGSSESTDVKMSHCWKSHALAQIFISVILFQCVFEETIELLLRKRKGCCCILPGANTFQS